MCVYVDIVLLASQHRLNFTYPLMLYYYNIDLS